MNKKQAISYAQITLGIMLSSNFNDELNLQNFELKMKQVFKTYPKYIAVQIAEGKVYAEKNFNFLNKFYY